MSLKLTQTHRDIESALNATGRFNQVGIWLGDIPSLIAVTKGVPSAWVLLSIIDFEEPHVIGAKAARSDTDWSIIAFEYVSREFAGDIAVYHAIETSVAALTNMPVGNKRLWPVTARLLGDVKNAVCCYGMQFTTL